MQRVSRPMHRPTTFPASLEQTPASIATNNMTHLTNSPKPQLLLLDLPRSTLFKPKTPLFNKSYPDSSSSPCLPSRLNSKHHPALSSWICISILFWIRACETTGSRDFDFVGAVEISSRPARLRFLAYTLDGL